MTDIYTQCTGIHMLRHGNFSESEMARFEHEPERRSDRHPDPFAALPTALTMHLQRSAPNPRDMTLSSFAVAWQSKLPADARAVALCETYPRIANRLAICWGDTVLTENVFKGLLNDRRRGRRGFPPAVKRELESLRSLAFAMASTAKR